MKQHILSVLLLFAFIPLFAPQVHAQVARGISVYFPPVTGTGKTQDDNAFFSGKVAVNLIGKNCTLTGSDNQALFSLTGTISPCYEDVSHLYELYYGDMEDRSAIPDLRISTQLYIFHLALSDNDSGEIIAEQGMIYSSPEDLTGLIDMTIQTILSSMQTHFSDLDVWRNRLWYFGVNVSWSPRIYTGSDVSAQSTNFSNFGFGLLAEFHVANHFSMESGFEMAPDWVKVSNRDGDDYHDFLVEVPVLLKLVLKPSAFYMIEPYAGLCFNVPLYRRTDPPPLAWRIGVQYGVKAGPGVFFLEPRFTMDMGKSSIPDRPGEMEYQRYIIDIGFGYKYSPFRARHF